MIFNSLIWDVTAKVMRFQEEEDEKMKIIPFDSYSSL